MKILFLCLFSLLVVSTMVTCIDEEVVTSGSKKEDLSKGAAGDEAKKTVKKKKNSKDWNKLDFNNLEKQWENGDEAEEREYEFEHSEKIMKKKAKKAAAEAKAKAKAKAKADSAKAKKKSTKDNKNTKNKVTNKGKNANSKIGAANSQESNGDWIPPPPGLENIDMSQVKGPGGMSGASGGLPPELQGFNVNDMDQSEKEMGPQMWFIDITMEQVEGGNKGKRWTRSDLDKLGAFWGEMMKTAHLSAKMYVLGEYKIDPETKKETGPTMLVSLDKAWQQREITKYIATRPEVVKLTKNKQTLSRYDFLGDDDDDEL